VEVPFPNIPIEFGILPTPHSPTWLSPGWDWYTKKLEKKQKTKKVSCFLIQPVTDHDLVSWIGAKIETHNLLETTKWNAPPAGTAWVRQHALLRIQAQIGAQDHPSATVEDGSFNVLSLQKSVKGGSHGPL
jgi:hypothetical protein